MREVLFKILITFLVFFTNQLVAADMPILFIGTYNENNSKLINNLVIPNLSSEKNDGWGLSKYTEELLKNEYKNKLSNDKFNIVLKDDFDKNYKKIILNSDDGSDKKIGFFNINTFENSVTLASGQKLVYITINLVFAEIGEEANRNNQNDNFEVRYTNGITTTGILGIQPKDNVKLKLQSGYRSFYKQALGDLIDTIIHDKKSKKVSSFTSNDIYFSISKMGIGKKAKDLALKTFGTKKIAKEQILMMLQEALIKKLRSDKRLDDVVLLYPDMLNIMIFKNWKDYLKRINSVFLNSNVDSEVIVRRVKKTCLRVKNKGSVTYVNGYFIEAMISELYDKLVKKEDVNSVKYIKSSIVSRVVLPLEGKKSIDGLSLPTKILKKRKLVVGQASFGYDIVNTLISVQKNKITKTIRKSVEELAPKLKKLILDIVIQREKTLSFDYQDFCKQ